MPSAFSASYNSLQIVLDRIHPELIADMLSEDAQDLAHPDDVALQGLNGLKHARKMAISLFTTPVAGLLQFPSMDPANTILRSSILPLKRHWKPAWSQPEYDSVGDPHVYGPKPLFPQAQNLQMKVSIRTYQLCILWFQLDTMMDADTFMSSVSDSHTTMYLSDGSS
ncbi:hypothetical protein BDR07DRAFT_1487835 [Suillus spraguei]|nr:hypothetical protein BDR07DRAFT_1502866 [Suillus spraguei]KAG2359755.1 hypothetical protein BDR07DRAFT_1487835 [Suillus spraguei]